MKPTTALLFLTALGIPSIAAAAPNLIVNPGFENPPGDYRLIPGNSTYLTGWKTLYNGVEIFTHDDVGYNYPGPKVPYPSLIQDGLQAVDVAVFTFLGGGGIEQSFSTTAGLKYEVSFLASTVNLFGKDGTGNLVVEVDGVTQNYALVNMTPGLVWQNYNFDFTASGSTATLRFASFDDPNLHMAAVDAVSVVALTTVPEPEHVAAVVGISLLAFAGWRRRRS